MCQVKTLVDKRKEVNKMTLYDVIIKLGQSHCRFAMKCGGYADLLRFNLKDKSIYNGDLYIMKNGKVVIDEIKLADGQEFTGLKQLRLIDRERCLENLYAGYYNSTPSKHCQFSKSNFIARDSAEMNVFELADGMDRIEAQYKLECYVMFASMMGWLDDLIEEGKFFWNSENYPKFVLFKEWTRKE